MGREEKGVTRTETTRTHKRVARPDIEYMKSAKDYAVLKQNADAQCNQKKDEI